MDYLQVLSENTGFKCERLELYLVLRIAGIRVDVGIGFSGMQ